VHVCGVGVDSGLGMSVSMFEVEEVQLALVLGPAIVFQVLARWAALCLNYICPYCSQIGMEL
jgi:hypothetical protein